ncbi:uncharacterized protein B0H64DRAFT_234029 [Chaetomium fimeti]|uniref:CFEM domain-containing protein n=1 Tax=Chaetomium fimeti TaxID=1854472 RepID=A0AAE0HBR1_9PEZI|nr:hypothetical protein B0H64DRAFT_234029 [Chaetomium fimeti]
MRSTIWAAALAIAGLAVRSWAQEMPTCASDCLVKYLPESKCDPTNMDCVCADLTLMDNVGTCTLEACTLFEALAAKNATATLCKEPVRDRSLVAPIATAITGGMALVFVILRVYESGFRKKEFHWADVWAILAMVSSIPMDVGEFFMMAHGMGKDIWTLAPEEITEVVKYTWITQVFYAPAIMLTKITVVCFFMRVFPARGFQLVCWGTIAHCVLFIVSTTIAAILACVPVEAAWIAWTGTAEAVCFNNNAFWWAHAAINIITDVWILALPIPQLLNLQLGRRKKVYLIMMFSVGLVITIISIVRFSGLITYSTSTNPTFNNVNVATYSVIECNISIMCCCMPAMLSFLRHVMPTVFGSTNRSDNNGKDGSYQVGGTGGRSPFPSNAIQKSVTHTVSYFPRGDDSDVVELMDVEKNRQGAETEEHYNRW